MLVALAGLPGTGKSTLARRLAAELGGVVLDKDAVRAALFPPPILDYSREQDDLTIRATYDAAALILGRDPSRHVILDGRTYSQAYQVRHLLRFAQSVQRELKVIECVCADEVVRERLERDAAAGSHPAGNRRFELYLGVKARAEPLTVARLVLDTGTIEPDECIRRVVGWVRQPTCSNREDGGTPDRDET
ncbi:MAG: ATP-binding protein [Gemmataceae bacterium]|nr:ATP-binding protein [Gemmataceae bacterium]